MMQKQNAITTITTVKKNVILQNFWLFFLQIFHAKCKKTMQNCEKHYKIN